MIKKFWEQEQKKSKAFQDFNLAYLTFEVSDSYTTGLFSAKLLFLDLSVELRGMSLSTWAAAVGAGTPSMSQNGDPAA